MKKQWLLTVIVLWVVSIATACLLAWNLGSSRRLRVKREAGEEPLSTAQVPAAEERLRREPAQKLADLERENAELREELAELKDEVRKAASDCLMYAISQALQDAAEREVSTQQVHSTWKRGIEQIERAGGGLFGGVGGFVALAAEIALLGEQGIRCLSEIAWDTERATEEREDALEVLGLMPHKLALETIMEMPDPESFGMYFPYDAIEGQLLRLPTADIQEYVPQITRHLSSAVGADEFSSTGGTLAAILAFVHEDTFCSRLLHDPRVWQEDLDGVLWEANYVHTDRAKEFLEEVRRTHRNEEYCTRAAEMLEKW